MKQKIFIKTFGCQMNEYDSNRIYDSLNKIGFILIKQTNKEISGEFLGRLVLGVEDDVVKVFGATIY